MTVTISAENEQFLNRAIAEGRFANQEEALQHAIHLLRHEPSPGVAEIDEAQSVDQWVADLHRWVASHRHLDQVVEFDRDAIYAGRGQ